ncbi:hypothetical protein GALMADRAFT_234684 [Galerina marginata CBS 339.88]|uniref:non-specific serine/threonine protein kinase n=1 Tax=Galerina marginata (strain CBS 339.88) TaxID=685588 RepID=A0A067TTL6_GALM3|nr:hypothetical protein GALMADRAFT_234684 [Galerina marginata CBS 339.88]
MANQQVYQAYPQNKGTLIPGQTISVNNYTVQVERYLSQGGFAHVYLVRTPTPVYNTTHHVLKRIAVANESMLTEVKKEVDIMRLLKGHPNIVHLIDAAWHKLPNGTFEVFILMEYCPGGGIIDMMNRRLRERLTEAEILQIFVDVCEGVAYMHNSRPPLLHRDLKVENILQSSSTSFKLCDFGSATTVSNPPTNMQEIRALEADLNRHTTLQYRAPEMVDVYSKRPVNEKSDVWALGVLLYKLCYYTTPFEEHGPLAILNVQYRIPPYPVYSQDMNMLIASMLREHGAQRPTVFELLNHVHRLRGTKSKFSYNVPVPPPLVPRIQAHAKLLPSPNPLDGVVSYGMSATKPVISTYDPKSLPNPPAPNQGIQARDKVLEAIAPMRRGRPTTSQSSTSRPSSPQKNSQSLQTNQEKPMEWSENGFGPEQDKAWKAVTEKNSSVDDSADAWGVSRADKKPQTEKRDRPPAFGDDFAEKLWNSSDPNSTVPLPPRLSPRPNINMNVIKPTDLPVTPLAFTGTSRIRPKQDRLMQNRDKDAFEGLGLMTSTPKSAPTLGEARKLRTGLAIMGTSTTHDNNYRDPGKLSATSDRPSPSQSKYLSTTPFQPQSISPVPTPGTSSSAFYRPSPSPSGTSPAPSVTTDGLPIESRFPSLEELDAQFNPSKMPSANAFYPASVNDASSRYIPQMTKQSGNRSQYSSRTSYSGPSGTGGNLLKPSVSPNISRSVEGVRSEQVTGTAMRDQNESRKPEDSSIGSGNSLLNRGHPTGNDASLISLKDGNSITKPTAIRKHRSSVSMKPAFVNGKSTYKEDFRPTQNSSNDSLVPPKLPPRPSGLPASTPPRDWLTGEEYEDPKPHITSDVPVLRESPSKRASFIETSNFVMPSSATAQHVSAPERLVDEPQSAELSPTVSKFKRSFPAIDKIDAQPISPSSLTDNWSPIATRKDIDVDSSSADEEPEEPKSNASVAQKRNASRAKGRQGRQSSVHELVYQYGGGVMIKEKEKERERPFGQYNDDDFEPQNARPLGLAPPSTTRDLDRKTPSPTSNMVNPISTAPNRSPRLQPQAISDKPQPPIIAAKPASSSRSRPQSMFIFPSKSTDSSVSPPTITNLMPPQEAKPRATRRTSISDMVQRYEAIGGSAKPPSIIPPSSPSPVHRPVSAKLTSVPSESGRVQRSFPEPIKPVALKTSVSNDASSYSGGDPLKPKTTYEPVRQTTTGLSRTPTKVQRKFTTDKDMTAPGPSPTPDKGIQRLRRISVKAELPPMASSHSRSETSSTKPLSSESFRPPSSPRKAAMSVGEDSPSKSEEPERPYQGVGRLIDQWQKKSAEAEQARPVPPGKRADFITKRAGIVRGDDR